MGSMLHTDALCARRHLDYGLDHYLPAATLAVGVSEHVHQVGARTCQHCSVCYQLDNLKKWCEAMQAQHLVTMGMQ
jgi:hypothetical protein